MFVQVLIPVLEALFAFAPAASLDQNERRDNRSNREQAKPSPHRTSCRAHNRHPHGKHAQTVHDRPGDTARNHCERVLLPRHSHDARAGIDGSLNANSQEAQRNDDDSPLLEQSSAVLRDGTVKPSSDLSSQAILSSRGQCSLCRSAPQPIGQLCAMKNNEKQENEERQSRGCP